MSTDDLEASSDRGNGDPSAQGGQRLVMLDNGMTRDQVREALKAEVAPRSELPRLVGAAVAEFELPGVQRRVGVKSARKPHRQDFGIEFRGRGLEASGTANVVLPVATVTEIRPIIGERSVLRATVDAVCKLIIADTSGDPRYSSRRKTYTGEQKDAIRGIQQGLEQYITESHGRDGSEVGANEALDGLVRSVSKLTGNVGDPTLHVVAFVRMASSLLAEAQRIVR